MGIAFESIGNLGGVTMMETKPLTDNPFIESVVMLFFVIAVCMCLLFTNTSSFANEKSLIGEQQTSLKFNGLVLFDFDSDFDVSTWRIVNDTVMGGVSSSALERLANGGAVFTGNVSLENNGGFASLQSKPSAYDFIGYEGLAIRIKGDGKRYKFSLKSNIFLDSPRYEAAFTTDKGVWATLKIPFNTLVPTFRGRVLTNETPLDISKVKSFSFLISDKQAGPFRLEINWVKAY